MVQLTNTKAAFRPSKIIIRGLFCQYYSLSIHARVHAWNVSSAFTQNFCPGEPRLGPLLPRFFGRAVILKDKTHLRCSTWRFHRNAANLISRELKLLQLQRFVLLSPSKDWLQPSHSTSSAVQALHFLSETSNVLLLLKTLNVHYTPRVRTS